MTDIEIPELQDEHGSCPFCGIDLNSLGIWQYFYEELKSAEKADEIAAAYGATREKGRWTTKICIFDKEQESVTKWKCPECEKEWESDIV